MDSLRHATNASNVPEAPPTRGRQTVVAFTLALVAVAYLDRVCISTAAPAIKAELGLSDSQMGLVFSAFTFSYALFEIPSGWLADRLGARITLTRIVLWWSVMTAATGLAGGFLSLIAVRLLFGVGEAGTFPATARAYAHWLPTAERGRALGLAIMMGALGGAATQPIVAGLLAVMSWRPVFAIFGSVGLVWAIAWWQWFRDDPEAHPAVNAAELAEIRSGGAHGRDAEGGVPWSALIGSGSLRALCAMYCAALYGWYFYLTWLPTYLLRGRGFDIKNTGFLAALPLLSVAAGVVAGGWLVDRLAKSIGPQRGRRLPPLVGFPLAALAIVGAVMTPDPLTSALLLAAAAGIGALGMASAWVVAIEMGGPHAGVVTGTMNMFGNFGGALSPLVIGFCLDRWGSWELPLLSIAVLYVVAAACWLVIDPTERVLPEQASPSAPR